MIPADNLERADGPLCTPRAKVNNGAVPAASNARGKSSAFSAEMTSEISHYIAEVDFSQRSESQREMRGVDQWSLMSSRSLITSETHTMKRENQTRRSCISMSYAPSRCQEAKDSWGCMHASCPAADIVDSYNRYKSVMVMRGVQRNSGVVHKLREEDMMEMCFEVVKVNGMGRKQRRIIIIDRDRNEMRL